MMSGVGVAILVLVIALLLGVGLVSRRYRKVSTNEVMIIAGRKHRIKEADGTFRTIGHRIVKGGGTIIWPVVEQVNKLSLNAMTIEVNTEDAYTREGVPVIVDGVVVMKVGGDDVSIANAAERFLGFEPEKVEHVAKEVLGGHLRAICSTLTPEEINKDRVAFQQKVLDVAHRDFQNMGLIIDSFTVRQIRDKQGYFDALGKKSTAEVKRNARIGEAEALDRDALQKESEAKREGQTRKAQTEADIALANKERDVKMAQYDAEVAVQKARSQQAGPKSEAESRKEVVEAQTILAEREAERTRKELLASTVRPAEAEKDALIARSEGERQARILKAEASKQELQLEGEGTAEKTKEVGFAEAEVIQKKGEAEGEAVKAKLFAEAEGLQRRAEAMAQLNDASMKLEIAKEMIRTLPQIIKEAVAPLASVDSIRVIDFGGNGSGGAGNGSGGPLDRLLNVSPKSLAIADEIVKTTLGKSLTEMIQLVRKGEISLEAPKEEEGSKKEGGKR